MDGTLGDLEALDDCDLGNSEALASFGPGWNVLFVFGDFAANGSGG